jgi:hypothetical protein
MPKPRVDSIDTIRELLPFATEAEAAALHALDRHGDMKAAAEAMGLHYDAYRSRLREVRRRAAKQTCGVQSIPGYYIKQITTDGDGSPTAIQHRPEELPLPGIPASHQLDKISQLVDSEGRELLRWNKFSQEKVEREAAFWDAARGHAAEFKGLVAATRAPRTDFNNMLSVYAIGDAHCGLLSWGAEAGHDFDLKIWQTQLQDSMDLLVAQTPATEDCIVLNVGDWFHVQSSDFRTPSGGNRLDGDSRLGKITRAGFDCMRWIIERAKQKHARVRVINVRGNHDPDLSVVFNLWLQSAYENEGRVVIPDNFAYRDYLEFGRCLLGFTHGDQIAGGIASLPGLMATEQPEAWGRCQAIRMWLTGHVHHKRQMKLQEYPGVRVESFSTLAPKDAWHSSKGYLSEQGIESLVFHKNFGLKGRSYVSLAETQA